MVITVKQVNKAPIANADADQTVNENSLVTLNGSASTDPDNDKLSYLWIAPAGITLSMETAWNPSFTAPNVNQDTVLTFKLVVNDGIINSDTSKIQITVKQVLPVLKLISKTNDSVLPANEVSYQLFLKQGETYIVQNVRFQVNGDTTQFTIHAGEWIVLASPAQNSSLFIPTYLGNTLDWIDAEHVIIQDNENLFKEITCVMPEITNGGTGQISGVVYESSYTGTKSISIINTPELSDNPISEVLVRLFKKDSTVPILSVFTDSLGCYKFDRLEIAEYDLVVELPGYTKSGKFEISLSAEGPLATAYFAVNTTTQVITDNNLLLFSMVTIYPNPVLSDVTVDVGRTINGPYSISVYNIQGKLLIHREVTAVKNILDFSALLSGTYLIQICIGAEKRSTVIIKR